MTFSFSGFPDPVVSAGGASDEGYSSEAEDYSSADEGRPGLSRRSDPGAAGDTQAGAGAWPERPPERETGTRTGAAARQAV